MKAKHTPGTWTVSASTFEGEESLDYKRVGTKECSVADLILIDADANLIASAPELLAALQSILRASTAVMAGTKMKPLEAISTGHELMAALDAAIPIIAKATRK